MNDNMGHRGGDGNGLIPSLVQGEPRIRDLDLAARLGFTDPHKIRSLIERHAAALAVLGVSAIVAETSPKGGSPGKAHYLNRKQAIFITAKSETAEATEITIEIIERFDAYENGTRPALPDLSDPLVLQHLLADHLSKRIEAERRAVEAERVAEAATETVAAFDRIANADGSMCITDAAKALQVRPSDLFKFLRQNGWVYSRPGKAGDIAHQDKLRIGYLEHKVTTVSRSDGSEKTVEQVRVTPKGLAKLAKLLGGSSGPGGAPATLPLLRPNGLGGSSVPHAPAME